MKPMVFVFCFALLGCGVKAPPVAPEERIEQNTNLDCSPNDPECDATDPNYIPHKK